MLENVEPARTLLIQFAKWPQLGRVKTRLANTIGESAALDAHIQLTQSVPVSYTHLTLPTKRIV